MKKLTLALVLFLTIGGLFGKGVLAGNTVSSTSSTLPAAIQKGDWDSVKRYIENGGDPNWVYTYYKDYRECELSEHRWVLMKTPLLYLAVKNNNLELAEMLLSRRADPNLPHVHIHKRELILRGDGDRYYAINKALSRGNEKMVNLLLKYGANVLEADSSYYCPVELAVKTGSKQIVKTILHKSSNANFRDALKISIHMNCPEITRLLLEANADVSILEIADSSLMFDIIKENNIELLQMLLNAGYKQFKVAVWQDTGLKHYDALRYAIVQGRNEIAKMLIHAQTDIEDQALDGSTALLLATKLENLEIVQALIDAEANVNTTNSTGDSPILLAITTNHSDIAAALIKAGANINNTDSLGRTPLMLATFGGNVPIVRLLLDRGDIDVNKADSQGNTALKYAVGNEDVPIIEMILKKDSRFLDKQCEFNGTALLSAVLRNNFNITSMLLKAGADVTIPDINGFTPLMYAVKLRNFKVVEIIASQKNVILNYRNNLGETALMMAVDADEKEILKFLLDKGADPRISDNSGQTALGRARKKGCKECIQILEENMFVTPLPIPTVKFMLISK